MLEGATETPPEVARGRLEALLRGELRGLLPDGPLAVQTFQDQKYSREGFGDVLFAPAERGSQNAAPDPRMRALLGILDPELLPDKATSP
jgi:hypothetical protein